MKKFAFLMLLLCAGMNVLFAQITVPTLSSPMNGSTQIPVTTTLYCTAVTGAARYIYQWDTTSTFDSPLCTSMSHNYYGLSISSLKFG
ncbi:MAG: hypothetical protein PUF10_08560, partial [Bacteroidales bacterium]|nr:hypothetical protein [Bacteroidales bacterium]